MIVDHYILIICWLLAILLLLLFVPLHKLRYAIVVFMFKQSMTWLFGLMVVQMGLIEYPIREFPAATGTSFAFEYFIYPATCVVFVLRYPEKKGLLYRITWYLFWPTWMSAAEYMLERHTHLVHYLNWTIYWTWLTLLATFALSRLFYRWYFHKNIQKAS